MLKTTAKLILPNFVIEDVAEGFYRSYSRDVVRITQDGNILHLHTPSRQITADFELIGHIKPDAWYNMWMPKIHAAKGPFIEEGTTNDISRFIHLADGTVLQIIGHQNGYTNSKNAHWLIDKMTHIRQLLQ
jgi:hypothetical protein